MKRVIALTAAALMTGSLFAAPAMAQINLGVDADANVGVGTDAGTTKLDADTTAAIGSSFDGLLSAMGDTAASSSIGSMTEVSTVNVIRINEMTDTDADALAKAKTDNQASIDDLKSSIEGNAEVKAALEQQGVEPDSVVAANVAADGSLTVYVE